jgi:hypothetical protein
MMAAIQKGSRKADPVLLLRPASDGTSVATSKEIVEIRPLLEAGLPIAEAVMPHTRPPQAEHLSFFESKTEVGGPPEVGWYAQSAP